MWPKRKKKKNKKRNIKAPKTKNIVNSTSISNGETHVKKLITCAIPAILKYERARKKFQLGRLELIPLQRQYIEISSSIDGIPIKTVHTINFNKNVMVNILKCHIAYKYKTEYKINPYNKTLIHITKHYNLYNIIIKILIII